MECGDMSPLLKAQTSLRTPKIVLQSKQADIAVGLFAVNQNAVMFMPSP